MPAPSLRLRPLLQQGSTPDQLLAGLTLLDLIILFRIRGQGFAATTNVGGQVASGGGAAVRDARPPRQAHRDVAPRLALHMVDHNSSNARGAA